MAHRMELHLTDEQWGLLQHCHWDMTKLAEVIEDACAEYLTAEAERGYDIKVAESGNPVGRVTLRERLTLADEVAEGTRTLGRQRRLRGAEPRADPGGNTR